MSITQIIVRLENMSIPNRKSGPIVIEADTGKELLEKVYETYALSDRGLQFGYLQIWSAPMGYSNRVQLDTLETFNKTLYDGYVRYVKY